MSVVIGNETGQSIKPAIGLLILTVLGGVALYFIIRRKGVLPKSIIFLHGTFSMAAPCTMLFYFPLQKTRLSMCKLCWSITTVLLIIILGMGYKFIIQGNVAQTEDNRTAI